MKIVKRILLALVILAAIAVIIGLMMPAERHIERSIVVNSSPESVWDQINDLKKWNAWSPWYKLDPNSAMTYSEPANGKGSWYTWDSQNSNVGKGKLTIEESIAGQVVRTKLEMEGMDPAHAYFNMQAEGEGTKLTWGLDAPMGSNPVFRLMGPMMDKMVGQSFEEGLRDIKTVSEGLPKVEAVVDSSSTDSIISN